MIVGSVGRRLVESNRNPLDELPAIAFGAAAYLVPYFLLSTWWRFIPSTLLIIATGAWVFRKDALRFFGLRLTARAVISTLALFGLAVLASHYVFADYVATFLEVVRTPTARSRVHQFFQVLNDELVMRAALLTLVYGVLPRSKIVITAMAAVFALSHWAFYGWLGVGIGPWALLTLFAFGVIGNTLFMKYGHIGYGFALHYAWNFYRFNTTYHLDGRSLREGETFNYIEGNAWIVAASTMLMFLVFGLYARTGQQASSLSASRAPL